jgi:mRNA interferase RelE/StbE
MKLQITYSKEADKFLKKNPDLISEDETDELVISAVKSILKMEDTNIDLKKLKGEFKGCFRIRKGDVRIIFSLQKEKLLSVFVHDIDFRGNIYK